MEQLVKNDISDITYLPELTPTRNSSVYQMKGLITWLR